MTESKQQHLRLLFTILCFVAVVMYNERQRVFTRAQATANALASVEGDEHLHSVVLEMVIRTEEHGALRSDPNGVIVWCNDVFIEQFGIGVGNRISDCLPSPEKHNYKYRQAVKNHAAGEGTVHKSFIGQAINAQGEDVQVKVDAWTTPSGGAALTEIVK